MSLPQNQHTDLNVYFNNQEFIDATIAQLNKDLQGLFFSELKSDFNTDSSIIDQLTTTLQPVLQSLSKQQPEQLSQFIYRVDLGEKKYIDSLAKDLSLKDLSYLVVEREAQKVYLRKKFST